MELNEFKEMWQTHEAKLEASLKLNLRAIDLIQTYRIRSKMTTILWQRIVESIFHGAAIGLLIAFIIGNLSDWRYTVSALCLLVFYTIAFISCMKQIVTIRRMDYSDDLVTIQSSLVMLQAHMVNLARLVILCIPFFLAFPMVVSKAIEDLHLTGLSFMDIRAGYKGDWWKVQLWGSVGVLPVSVWLFERLSYRNIQIAWIRKSIRKFSGSQVTKALELLSELKSLKSTDLVGK